ncbi:MAG: hypothetical protein CM1200mP20_00930 [Pseudomonadota bacterium]|nr:MAG: hypothetical protein CM1200mP20_00930 [Pseudomonadota bacterium]
MNIALPLLFVLLGSGAFIAERIGFPPDISPITFLAPRVFPLAGLILCP